MKTLKTSLIFLILIGWIFVTNYKFYPLNSIGELFTYKSGILSIPLDSNENLEIESRYDLKILIDNFGVPHIYSKNDSGIAYGIGYMHAKDRFFQMELVSRMVSGELSEILGPRALDSDIFWKPFEFKQKAIEVLEEYKKTDNELYQYLLAYTEGLNDYIENNKLNDPLYKIFNLNPKKWRPEYSLLITWYMSKNLSYFDYHLEQEEILNRLPIQFIEAFYPINPKDTNTILANENQKKVNRNFISQNRQTNKITQTDGVESIFFKTDVGSNNWVINSAKSINNTTILANDPHLPLTLPNIFYEVHLTSSHLHLYGFTIPGIPLIITGHNESISWGITNGEWDLTDRYSLKVKNDNLYLLDGEWVPFLEKEYSYYIRGVGNKTIINKNTVHGKLIQEKNNTYYSQKWYPSEKSYSIRALYNVMHSKDWDGFNMSLKDFDYPPLNFIYSDIEDNIGIVCAGKLPLRVENFMGGLLDGTKQPLENVFIDTVWKIKNPIKNYLFSGNQQPVQNKFYFGAHWHKDDYRVNRIADLLENKNDWDSQSMMRMQLDDVDISFQEFNKLIQLYNVPNESRKFINELKYWDSRMTAGSKQAFLYDMFRRSVEIESRKFAKQQLNVIQAPSFKYFMKYLLEENINLPDTINKQQIVTNLFKRTDSILKKENNKETTPMRYENETFIYNISFLPGFGEKIKNLSGNKNTINMNAGAHPVFRIVFEMNSNKIRGFVIIAGGQSGKMNSKNYKDQLEKWKKGKYRKIEFEKDFKKLKNIQSTIIFKKL